MSTRKLNGIDFMIMDVHRSLTNDEVEEINPQAAVDKSAGPFEDEHCVAAGVDTPYPYEVPLPDNVTIMPGVTTHDLSTEEVMRAAFNADLTEMVIVGIDEEGHEHIFRTNADLAPAMFHLQRGMHNLNRMHDGLLLEEDRD